MIRSLSLAVLSLVFASAAIAGPLEKTPAPVAPSYDPTEHWELGFETSALWSLGGGASPLDYTFLPQIVTLKSGAMLGWDVGGGRLVLSNRFSFLGEPIIEGPESYFIGGAAGGSLEWWNASRSCSLFLSSGGGVGWMDSKGYEVEGGQGQDFNLNWYIHSGVTFRIREKLSATLGVYFQHISNGGQDDINPGVNALGPTAGLVWHF